MKTVGNNSSVILTRSATNQLFRLLFPPICAGCDIHVAEPGTLCGACWSRVRFIEKPCCPVLGIPFSHDLGAEILSAEAIADPPPFRRARSVAAHEGVIRDMVHRLKYNDRTDLGAWMARWMAAGRQGTCWTIAILSCLCRCMRGVSGFAGSTNPQNLPAIWRA